MSKRFTALALACILAALPAGAALAKKGSTNQNIDQRQANQEQRIQQGVQSGQLTPEEAAKLRKGEDRIAKREAKLRSDGQLTPNERKQLNHQLDVQSKKIKREKSDKQKMN